MSHVVLEYYPLPETDFALLENVFSFIFVRHPFDKLVSAIQMGYLRKALTKKLQQRIVY